MPAYSHLHCHSQFSLLDGQASLKNMVKKAVADGMPAIGLTDHGNMFGAFEFVLEAKGKGIKPIVGCEFYLVADRHKKSFTKEEKDRRNHQLMLAKNQEGYRNLSRLCSLGFIEGMYSKYPRIDKELIEKYHEGLIATTCCLAGEVPQAILHLGEEKAEEIFRWWLDLFGEDYYIELQRHNIPEQEKVNAVLLKWAAKYGTKIICSNDSHYVDQDDSEAHDILLCVNTGEQKSTPIWTEEGSAPKGYRFGFSNNQFYFKTTAEMAALFSDIPQSLDNTQEIVDKVTPPEIKRDILLPNFPLPPEFKTLDAYLRHLTFAGAVKRYGVLTPEIDERLNFELQTIETMGFAGYFLIVQDFINAGKDMGVYVGPGRGSAAGSAVAYCIGITNIDPIKYNLLFERFLNPERVTMPDMDIDFDDENRAKVIDYVINRYGKERVAQVVTYGSMAAKMSIKDVARVLDLPLAEANALAKLVPERPGISLDQAMSEVEELGTLRNEKSLKGEVLRQALKLEGSVRNTGIHAAALIIAPDPLIDNVPLCVAKDSDLYVTQFEGKRIEDAGMLKMDFLGLKTLTIIRDAIRFIERNHGRKITLEEIPLEDEKTYELFQEGDTTAIFQFESEGMRTYLRKLKPTHIEDIIAMAALYRPGPMQFIDTYIDRKHGRVPVEYPHELLKGILEPTNGIMVYQEQIMQSAQIMAGYSLGGADLLRRAMGKKDKEKMAKEREKFIKGAKEHHGVSEDKAGEVFAVMEKFAEYGFNRSHSAAYGVLAYQTAYLKAHYKPEFMASVLNHNIGSIEKITFFLDECKRQGIVVNGPDVNRSQILFDVKDDQILFGLSAIKGIGEAAVASIIEERERKGPYTSIFDFAARANLKAINRKALECLAQAGAFDCFADFHRAQYFAEDNGTSFLERLVKYGQAMQGEKDQAQSSLFGGGGIGGSSIATPKVPVVEPWSEIEKLRKEKDVVGFYLSGHPLDQFRLEINTFCTCTVDRLQEFPNRDVRIAGVITNRANRQSKNGMPFAIFTVEDYNSSFEFIWGGRTYGSIPNFAEPGQFVFLSGRMKPGYRDPSVMEFEPQKMELLGSLRDKYITGLKLRITTERFDATEMERLLSLIRQHPGTTPLAVTLVYSNGGNGFQLPMRSHSTKVTLSEDLLKALPSAAVEVGFDAKNPE